HMWSEQWPEDDHETAMDIVGGYDHEHVLSVYNGSLIAYGLFSPMNTPANAEFVKPLIECEIEIVDGHSESLEAMHNYLAVIQEATNKELLIEPLSNFIYPKENHYYFGANLVKESFRGLGLGSEILKRRIDLALERGAGAIYAHCSSPVSLHLFEKEGFTKILKRTPAYFNGNSSVLVAKKF
ncbi:GNAT family N-acetyltransferase, partial [Candidatus Woesearchaeota archaeon]|nr:GNAT family N-acetyltransferase [Candidatus Woesearchaeota archaeon]